MTDYEHSDQPCLRCGHAPTHQRPCEGIGCEDGWIDLYDEDPFWYDPGQVEMCLECKGTGIEKWCPKCGANLSGQTAESDDDERDQGITSRMPDLPGRDADAPCREG